MADPGLGLRFKVAIDGHELGNWQKCDGLNVEYDIQEYREGGQNGFVHRLPGRAKYENVKLDSTSRLGNQVGCQLVGQRPEPRHSWHGPDHSPGPRR